MSGFFQVLLATIASGLTVNNPTSGSSGAVPTTITGATMTFSGNGTIRFNVADSSGGGLLQYSKNGAAFANIVDEATLVITNGDTLAIRSQGLSNSANDVVEIFDKPSGGTVIHTFTAIGI